jgi:hypothetical protein
MKTKTKIWAAVGCLALIAFGMAVSPRQTPPAFNELSLTQSDLAQGGFPDVVALRAKTTAVADAHLVQLQTELQNLCGGPFKLTFDDSLSKQARNLGYQSSFYYFCWDLYLPYSLQPESGVAYTLLVQLSDRTPGNKHDPDKFHVLRTVVLLDQNGLEKRVFENRQSP